MPVHLINLDDEPVLEDILKRSLLVEEVAQVVQEARPPQVFAVHGDWGAGKTSFLKQVCERYRKNGAQVADRKTSSGAYEKLGFIWFEAWRYQHEGTPIVALLHEIRDHFSALDKTKGWFKKLGEVGVRGLLRTFTELSFTIGGASVKTGSLALNIQTEGESWEQSHFAVALPTAKVRKFLEQAIRQLLGGEADEKDTARRLVIVVDDLDRCEGEAVVRFLEGIKIYLSIPNCIFLLGLNQSEVEHAVARHVFGMDDEIVGAETPAARAAIEVRKARAAAYVEKICGFCWKLPLLSTVQIAAYLDHLLRTVRVSDGLRTALVNVISNYDCLPANPRRIKAFANTLLHLLRARSAVLRQANDESPIPEADAPAIVLVAAIHLFHPSIFRYLQSNRDFFQGLLSSALEAFNKPEPEFSPLDPTHTFAADPAAPGGFAATSLFSDVADNRVCRVQRLIVQGGLTDADLRPYLDLSPL